MTPGARADPDQRHRRARRDPIRHFRRHGFNQQHRAARLFQRYGIINNLLRALDRAPRRGVSARERDILRPRTDVAADRNARVDDLGNALRKACIRFDLDDIRHALGEKLPRVADRRRVVRLIRHEGHVAHHDTVRRAALHTSRERDEHIQRHIDRALQTKHHLRRSIANQQHMHATTRQPLRCRSVIARQTSERLGRAGHAGEGLQCDPRWGGVFGMA